MLVLCTPLQVKRYWNELQFNLTFVKYIKIEILFHTVSVFHTDTTFTDTDFLSI